MSFELDEDLSKHLVHMQTVLDGKITRVDALVLIADIQAKEAQAESILGDLSERLVAVENETERLAEQIS